MLLHLVPCTSGAANWTVPTIGNVEPTSISYTSALPIKLETSLSVIDADTMHVKKTFSQSSKDFDTVIKYQ